MDTQAIVAIAIVLGAFLIFWDRKKRKRNKRDSDE